MRKVIASLFLSLDGVAEAPQEWHLPYFNDEMGAAIGDAMATSDAFLLGRATYEVWGDQAPSSWSIRRCSAAASSTPPTGRR